MTAATAPALQAALRIEHEVVYGYGVAGAHLRGQARRQALQRLAEHQLLRDRLIALVRSAGAQPLAARPAYRLPAPVADAAGAIDLLVRLEDGCAGACWDVVAAAASHTAARRTGVQALATAASWGSRWRARVGRVDPALPGRP